MKKAFLEISQNLQENTYAGLSFLMDLQSLEKNPIHTSLIKIFRFTSEYVWQ